MKIQSYLKALQKYLILGTYQLLRMYRNQDLFLQSNLSITIICVVVVVNYSSNIKIHEKTEKLGTPSVSQPAFGS